MRGDSPSRSAPDEGERGGIVTSTLLEQASLTLEAWRAAAGLLASLLWPNRGQGGRRDRARFNKALLNRARREAPTPEA